MRPTVGVCSMPGILLADCDTHSFLAARRGLVGPTRTAAHRSSAEGALLSVGRPCYHVQIPQRSLKPCMAPGCPRLVRDKPRCEAHTVKRMSRVALGYGAVWQMVRNAHINEHPWCVACAEQGVQTPASEVDHIQPVPCWLLSPSARPGLRHAALR